MLLRPVSCRLEDWHRQQIRLYAAERRARPRSYRQWHAGLLGREVESGRRCLRESAAVNRRHRTRAVTYRNSKRYFAASPRVVASGIRRPRCCWGRYCERLQTPFESIGLRGMSSTWWHHWWNGTQCRRTARAGSYSRVARRCPALSSFVHDRVCCEQWNTARNSAALLVVVSFRLTTCHLWITGVESESHEPSLGLTLACRRPPTAYASASLRLPAAPEARR
ncbi:hypothetical protein NKDENANG_03805 [Candidatus Entotheonellaceae bacterium PAL068K]